jgi:hypothetical protein
MAIAAKPIRTPTDSAKPDPMEFIQGAEQQQVEKAQQDAVPPRRARKEPVIIRFDAETLSRLDQAAIKRGLSRAALVRLLVMEHLPD